MALTQRKELVLGFFFACLFVVLLSIQLIKYQLSINPFAGGPECIKMSVTDICPQKSWQSGKEEKTHSQFFEYKITRSGAMRT